MNNETIPLTMQSEQDSLAISYQTNVLERSGNNKTIAKSSENNLKLIAVRITNKGSKSVNTGRDLIFSLGGRPVKPVEPSAAYDQLRQSPGAYWLYMLLLLFNVNITNGEGEKPTVIPVGLVLAPVLSINNKMKAEEANRKLLTELIDNDISSRVIAPGESVSGLLIFRTATKKTDLTISRRP